MEPYRKAICVKVKTHFLHHEAQRVALRSSSHKHWVVWRLRKVHKTGVRAQPSVVVGRVVRVVSFAQAVHQRLKRSLHFDDLGGRQGCSCGKHRCLTQSHKSTGMQTPNKLHTHQFRWFFYGKASGGRDGIRRRRWSRRAET